MTDAPHTQDGGKATPPGEKYVVKFLLFEELTVDEIVERLELGTLAGSDKVLLYRGNRSAPTRDDAIDEIANEDDRDVATYGATTARYYKKKTLKKTVNVSREEVPGK